MTTTLFEADIILNGKKKSLINTETSIVINWDVLLIKKEKLAELTFTINQIKGNFHFIENNDSYKKKINIDFISDSTWEFQINEVIIKDEIFPVYGLINLDSKSVFLKF